jgi:hypothetical protein
MATVGQYMPKTYVGAAMIDAGIKVKKVDRKVGKGGKDYPISTVSAGRL